MDDIRATLRKKLDAELAAERINTFKTDHLLFLIGVFWWETACVHGRGLTEEQRMILGSHITWGDGVHGLNAYDEALPGYLTREQCAKLQAIRERHHYWPKHPRLKSQY